VHIPLFTREIVQIPLFIGDCNSKLTVLSSKKITINCCFRSNMIFSFGSFHILEFSRDILEFSPFFIQ